MDQHTDAARPKRGTPGQRNGMWAVVVVAALLIAVAAMRWDRTSMPGASPALYFAALALLGLAAVLAAPPAYFRLPTRLKLATWAMLLAGGFAWSRSSENLQLAFERTPGGYTDATARADRARADADRAETEQLLAHAADTEKKLKSYIDKAEGCFSWGHHLRKLEDAVRDSLQNPHSFEHVRTELVVPDASNNNIRMTFRAENGFGALRTAYVDAQLVADDCSVQNIGEPQTE